MRQAAAMWILVGVLGSLPTVLREPDGGITTAGYASRVPMQLGTAPLGHEPIRNVSGRVDGGRLPRERLCPFAGTARDLLDAALAWARCSDAWTDALSAFARSAAAAVLGPLARTLAVVLAPGTLVLEWSAIEAEAAVPHPEEVS